MLKKTQTVQRCNVLLAEFERNARLPEAEKLRFDGVGGDDVYNITAPFEDEGELVLAGRVEPRDDGLASRTVFFVQRHGVWQPRAEDASRCRECV